MVEYVNHLHAHSPDPVVEINGPYVPPKLRRYRIEIRSGRIDRFAFLAGEACGDARSNYDDRNLTANHVR